MLRHSRVIWAYPWWMHAIGVVIGVMIVMALASALMAALLYALPVALLFLALRYGWRRYKNKRAIREARRDPWF